MDWEPTASRTRKQRAKWVSQEEIDRRRANFLCMRCGSGAHLVKTCPFAPAVRPTNASTPTKLTPKQSTLRVTNVEVEVEAEVEGSFVTTHEGKAAPL